MAHLGHETREARAGETPKDLLQRAQAPVLDSEPLLGPLKGNLEDEAEEVFLRPRLYSCAVLSEPPLPLGLAWRGPRPGREPWRACTSGPRRGKRL